ncbi:unnamed protein product [Cylindrotheca closterium]|uniref:Uncharacterized protein n=1 Tax=Cylindrotheca closterium TaxID=2856 RepID=A0AAD2CEG7_9STRA|nr:unnamed protein product [Cylindrotheca closterium]
MIVIIPYPKYEWFQRPCPSSEVTLIVAGMLFVWTAILFHQRVDRIKTKLRGIGPQPDDYQDDHFVGSLRICSLISAYMDHHEDPGFAILRLGTKAILFLGLMQRNFQHGFLIMLAVLFVECSLNTARILLVYQNCKSIDSVQPLADDEAYDITGDNARQLEPTNVQEDLTRPFALAVLVFLTQIVLIGLVLDDTYLTTTRTCFNGTTGCLMLTSLGSYCLYLMGTFMTCVYYVGPTNSYGSKELNPTFWLKLFLMNKNRVMFEWEDLGGSGEERTLELEAKHWTLWVRFAMSFLVNEVGFTMLLYVLPVKVAGQATIMGVVFQALGMVYLVDLDNCTGNVLTLVESTHKNNKESTTNGSHDYGSSYQMDEKQFEAEKQKIIRQAMKDVEAQLQALAHGDQRHHAQKQRKKRSKFTNITSALFLSKYPNTNNRQRQAGGNSEKSPLVLNGGGPIS